ncbi:hypothetical protein BDN72DRAFT_219234 [Pluteus cervinus]|uniref:Uncharacterized protein n=1 Tax=Pluteus cervinus TaxID=181527 RepID=A0ACD3AIC2_9AGAR|nr:hypothetical protein BDN72DRAFT_219234 [Pluteus cervinus]
MSYPHFPPEIENIIFTNALAIKLRSSKGAANLMLVAKRVHTWLISLSMRTIAIRAVPHAQKYPRRWSTEALKKYGKYTRNLFLWITSGHNDSITPDDYLSWCPNVTNLVLWTDQEYFPRIHLASLPLTHLSTNLEDISDMTPELKQLFSKITHLEVLNCISSSHDFFRLQPFTSITRLAVPSASSKKIPPMLFVEHPTLEVFVFADSGDGLDTPLRLEDNFDYKLHDPRIVELTCEYENEIDEWLLDVETGLGLWGLADDVAQQRKVLKMLLQQL